MLIEYVWERKHGRRQKKGMLFGGKTEDGTVCIGYSSCSPRDYFDREFGYEVAVERALKFCTRNPKKIPFSIQDKLPNFVSRCKRYFKTDKFPSWVESYAN